MRGGRNNPMIRYDALHFLNWSRDQWSRSHIQSATTGRDSNE